MSAAPSPCYCISLDTKFYIVTIPIILRAPQMSCHFEAVIFFAEELRVVNAFAFENVSACLILSIVHRLLFSVGIFLSVPFLWIEKGMPAHKIQTQLNVYVCEGSA